MQVGLRQEQLDRLWDLKINTIEVLSTAVGVMYKIDIHSKVKDFIFRNDMFTDRICDHVFKKEDTDGYTSCSICGTIYKIFKARGNFVLISKEIGKKLPMEHEMPLLKDRESLKLMIGLPMPQGIKSRV